MGLSNCCGGVKYNSNKECCENNKVVQKVTIYVFQGKLGGDEDKVCKGGLISHSYVSGNPNGIPSYGKHPRKFGEGGKSLKGPGYVNREDVRSDGKPGRDPSKAKKQSVKCALQKKRGCCRKDQRKLLTRCGEQIAITGPKGKQNNL